MAGTLLSVTVDDLQARAGAHRLRQADTRDLVRQLGEYLLRSTKDRFKKENQKAPDGTPWQPLKPRYARRKKYNKDRILTLRGFLQRSFRYQPEGDAAAVVGSNHETAAVHQLGAIIEKLAHSRRQRYRSVAGRTLFAGKRHKNATERWVTVPAHQVKIPARPMVGISTQDEIELADIVRDWLKALDGA